jgi:hypothetical protein
VYTAASLHPVVATGVLVAVGAAVAAAVMGRRGK